MFPFDIKEERKLFKRGMDLIVGIDEAGRGPLAGPVVAAAVGVRDWEKFFKEYKLLEAVNDSKRISASRRETAGYQIKQADFLFWSVGVCSEKCIDERGILAATKLAMKKAIDNLSFNLNFILIDGNFLLSDMSISQKSVVKGDSKIFLIAAASIIAKTYRDRMMKRYDKKYPVYGFARHKGYGTAEHYRTIARYGPCPIHRLSFNLKIKK